jgi:hypothetical protein
VAALSLHCSIVAFNVSDLPAAARPQTDQINVHAVSPAKTWESSLYKNIALMEV